MNARLRRRDRDDLPRRRETAASAINPNVTRVGIPSYPAHKLPHPLFDQPDETEMPLETDGALAPLEQDSVATTRFTQWPWRVAFAAPFSGRYVLIVQIGTGVMHLRRVQVFGSVLPHDIAADRRRLPENAGSTTTFTDA
jgi:hypothetical protein